MSTSDHPLSASGASSTSPLTAPGGHELPGVLRSDPLAASPAGRPRRKRTGLLVGSLAAVIAVGAGTAVQLSANLSYDDAHEELRGSAAIAADTRSGLRDEIARLEESTGSASLIVETDSGALVSAEARDALLSSVSQAEAATTEAETVAAQQIPATGEKPVWAWELYGAAGELREHRQRAEELSTTFSTRAEEIDAATETLEAAAIASLTSAADAAAGFEAAHRSARNLDVIALRDAADALLAATTTVDANATTAYAALEAAAAQVIVSENAELAEKAGPLRSARVEVEAFARSLAPGVLLDFDWAPIVNNAGRNGSMGGYTTWWYADGGYATIELSDSVAQQWPQARSKALIAHEVGHAISVKCADMYDSSTQDSIEKWATGWAISMGYTDDANGVWAYGYPPQSYIDAAAGCR